MEPSPERKKLTARWIIGVAAACIAIFLGLQHLDVVGKAISWCVSLLSPLVVGFALALILNVPMSFFERHLWKKSQKPLAVKLRRPVALILAIFAILAVLVGVICLVLPELGEAVRVIVDGIMDVAEMMEGMEETELSQLPLIDFLSRIDWEKRLLSLQDWLKEKSGVIFNTALLTVSSLVNGVFDAFISLVFAVYILCGKEKLKASCTRLIRVWLPEKIGSWSIHAASVANSSFHNFVSGQTLESLILAALCMLGMWVLKIPYAPMVGTLVGVTALIPVVGAFLGAIVGAFIILTVSPVKSLIFLVFIVILQQVEGNIIYPRVMGNRVNLPGMWILAAVTIGGGLAGAIGMLLSVPIAATVYVLLQEATDKREKGLEEGKK